MMMSTPNERVYLHHPRYISESDASLPANQMSEWVRENLSGTDNLALVSSNPTYQGRPPVMHRLLSQAISDTRPPQWTRAAWRNRSLAAPFPRLLTRLAEPPWKLSFHEQIKHIVNISGVSETVHCYRNEPWMELICAGWHSIIN